jgi:Cu(I)/Ag(I) efflux system protein CusF
MKHFAFLILAAVLGGVPAYADDAHHPTATVAQASSEALSEGLVRKVDLDAQKITIKHGPLANLDMPAMTMVFHVTDPAMLRQVKAGDSVRFRAESRGGVLTVTAIEPAR